MIFQQRRNLPENLSSREFRTATAFSSFLNFGTSEEVHCGPFGSANYTAATPDSGIVKCDFFLPGSGLAPPEERGENGRKMGELPFLTHFWANFPNFRPFFPFFPGAQKQGGPGSVRFGYGLGMERFERFRFLVPAVPLRRGFLCVSVQLNREDGSGFGSWKKVPAVPVPRSVPARKRFRRFRFAVPVRFLGHPAGFGQVPG